jgi:hypothetical protein
VFLPDLILTGFEDEFNTTSSDSLPTLTG